MSTDNQQEAAEQPIPADIVDRIVQAQMGTPEQSDLISAHMEEYFKRFPSYRDKFTDLEWYHIFLDFLDALHALPPSPIETKVSETASWEEERQRLWYFWDKINNFVDQLWNDGIVNGKVDDKYVKRVCKVQEAGHKELSKYQNPYDHPTTEAVPSPVGEAETWITQKGAKGNVPDDYEMAYTETPNFATVKYCIGKIMSDHLVFNKEGRAVEANPAIHRIAEMVFKYIMLQEGLIRGQEEGAEEWKAQYEDLKSNPSRAGETYSREEVKQIAKDCTKDFCGLPSEFDKYFDESHPAKTEREEKPE